jgi:glutamine synthetase
MPTLENSQFLEYIWIDGLKNVRSKTKIISNTHNFIRNFDDAPLWNFDGSSTEQATTHNSDVILRPVKIYNDPFRGQPHKLVLCDTFVYNKSSHEHNKLIPHPTNTRVECVEVYNKVRHHEPWFGIEQEYVLMERDNSKPYKWISKTDAGFGGQGLYYCGIGGNVSFGREIVEEHMKLCLQAGVHICGINAEVMASQWEFQIGAVDPITVSDDLWIARYILSKITEKYNCYPSYHPKIYPEWNGSGAHTNYSTKEMREYKGMDFIVSAIKKLQETHTEDIDNYGEYNELRLTGKHETSSYSHFSYGESNRGSSVRIPINVKIDGKGYFEDRRPASNMDPYLVCKCIMKSTLL